MKKTITALMIVSLMLTTVGCRQVPDAQTQTTSTSLSTVPTDTSAGTTGTPVIAQEPMAAVSVPAITESATAEDGTLLFQYTYQNMSLILPDPDVAHKVILDFYNRVDKTKETADSILSTAKSAYASSENWVPYLCHVTYNPARIDHGVLSLFGTNVTFNGASHPERTCVSASYDLTTGDVLTLASIMAVDASIDTFCQLTLDELAAIEEEKYLYDGYEATVKSRFNTDGSQDEAWYFTNTGLCFYFSPYEIAPYASGIITIEIPYEKLTNLLYDGYFPDELDTTTGRISAQYLKDADITQFTQTAELSINKEADMILLHTDTSVQNLRIESGSWNDAGTVFTPDYTAFAAYTLTPGDAVMIECTIPDSAPSLRITYTTGGEDTVSYIMLGGNNALLSPEN